MTPWDHTPKTLGELNLSLSLSNGFENASVRQCRFRPTFREGAASKKWKTADAIAGI